MRDVPIHGGGIHRTDAPEGAVLVPAFVDLTCDPGFPGFPAREDATSLAAAASAGGFGHLIFSPRVDPVVDTPEQLLQSIRWSASGVRFWPAAALSPGLQGAALTEIGLLREAGAVAISDGGMCVRDTVVLRNAMEYARAFGIPLLLRPADPDLDALGVVHEGPLSAQIGLRGHPPAAEEIGVARLIALARATRARVHLTHIGTARSIDLIAAAGGVVTASTPARNLVLDETVLADGSYDSRFRLHPPLRSAADRAALVDAVRAGVLWLTADHAPRAPEEKDHEFERAVPGSTGLESAFAAAMTATGDLDVVVRALSSGPASLVGCRGGYALVDPHAEAPVEAARHRSRARNDALDGRVLRGRVLGFIAEAEAKG